MLTELLRLLIVQLVRSLKYLLYALRNDHWSVNQSVSQSLKCLSCRATSGLNTVNIGGQTVRGITVQMMSAYMTVWKARFLDVDKNRQWLWWCPFWQHVPDLGTSNCESPAGCQHLKTWRVEPADDRIDLPPEREAPSRPYREASLCDVVMFFSPSRFGSVSKVLSLSSVSSQSRRSCIASALSLHPCNAATLGALASGLVRPIDRVNKVYTYCASARQAKC